MNVAPSRAGHRRKRSGLRRAKAGRAGWAASTVRPVSGRSKDAGKDDAEGDPGGGDSQARGSEEEEWVVGWGAAGGRWGWNRGRGREGRGAERWLDRRWAPAHTKRTWVFLLATKPAPQGLPPAGCAPPSCPVGSPCRCAGPGKGQGRKQRGGRGVYCTRPGTVAPGEAVASGRIWQTLSEGRSGTGQEPPGREGPKQAEVCLARPSTQLSLRAVGRTRLRARGWPGEPGCRPPSCSHRLLAGGMQAAPAPPCPHLWPAGPRGRLRAGPTLPAYVTLACSALVPLRKIAGRPVSRLCRGSRESTCGGHA